MKVTQPKHKQIEKKKISNVSLKSEKSLARM